ncbi:hypothetical protein Taro_027902, partial [Colocasia esculenta]|nr:hypothetical protein [Colocasia esculenta]
VNKYEEEMGRKDMYWRRSETSWKHPFTIASFFPPGWTRCTRLCASHNTACSSVSEGPLPQLPIHRDMEEGNAPPPPPDPLPPRHGPAIPPPRPANMPPDHGGGRRMVRVLHNAQAMSLLHIAALAFLTYNSALAVCRARNDPWTLAFVVSAYSSMMLLFWCLRAFEAAPPEKKERLKLVIWLLAMALNAMFSYRVASMMPFGFAVAIWATAGVTTVAGFYAFFVWGNGHRYEISFPSAADTESAYVKT